VAKSFDEKEIKEEAREWKRWHRMRPGGGSSGAIYFFGLVGSLVYFIQHAATFGDGIIGIIKAIGWPGVLVYQVLQQFHI
jgi:hypothetical protein